MQAVTSLVMVAAVVSIGQVLFYFGLALLGLGVIVKSGWALLFGLAAVFVAFLVPIVRFITSNGRVH